MLVLRAGYPGQAVEQQLVGVARCEPAQFGPRAVQDDHS
ncbi:Uncharacterised protein [Mycobacterium tuberculosis]|nr:Uncharacterised protein [Mycobacterium tuberculosis]COZ48021.1 Uncharacterised protein [Mycobacterium tuberculosis]